MTTSPLRGLMMIEPSVIPADHQELIRAAMASGRKPQPRPRLTNLAGAAAAERGTSGILFAAGVLSVICVDGVLSQGEDPFSWLFGGCSLEAVAQAYRDAADDPSTKATLVRMSSPGGSCLGNADVQAAITYHLAKKPIHAIANDQALSGGYYCIARANEIVALSSSMVGSVGVFFGTFYDDTGYLAKEGLVAWVGSTGKLKGAGYSGVKVTEDMKAATQRVAEESAVDFFAAVAAGRKMSVDQVKALEAGYFVGASAVTARLADRIVSSFVDYAAELQNKYAQAPATAPSAAPPGSPKPVVKESAMPGIDWSKVTDEDVATMPAALKQKAGIVPKAEDPKPEGPATPAQLKEAFPENAEFRGKALDNGWTITEARNQHVKALAEANAALQAKNKELEGAIAKGTQAKADVEKVLGGKPGGAAPVSASAQTSGNDYESEIRATMRAKNVDRFAATKIVNETKPELFQSWHESRLAAGSRK